MVTYVINLLVESDGCGESASDLLRNLILLLNVIHHIMDVVHITGGGEKGNSACPLTHRLWVLITARGPIIAIYCMS